MTNKYSTQINALGASLGVIALSIGQLSQQIAEANFNLLKLATDINDAENVTLKMQVDTSQITDAIDHILGQLGVVSVVVDNATVYDNSAADAPVASNYDTVLSILTERIVTAQKEVHLGVFGANERLARDTQLINDVQGGNISADDALAFLTRAKTWHDIYDTVDPNASPADEVERMEPINVGDRSDAYEGDGDDDISEVVEKPVEPKTSEIDAGVMDILEGRGSRGPLEDLNNVSDEEVVLVDPEVAVADASFPVEGESADFAEAVAAAELAETVAQAVVAAPASEGVDYSIGGGFYHNKLTEVDAAGLLQFAHQNFGTQTFTADALFQLSYNRGQKKVRDDAGFRVTGRGPVFMANLIDFLDALSGNTFKASIGDNPTDARKLSLKKWPTGYQIIDGGNI